MGKWLAIKAFFSGNMWIMYLVATVAIFAAGAASGWQVNGWRLSSQLADLKTAQQKSRAEGAEAAIQDMIISAQNIKHAADDYIAIRDTTSGQLTQIRKDLQYYANKTPLPVDCKPDVGRVQRLHSAIDTANQALTGQRPSGAVSSDTPAK